MMPPRRRRTRCRVDSYEATRVSHRSHTELLLAESCVHSSRPSAEASETPYLLDVVVGQGAAILELLAGEDQALLVRGNALLVLDLALDIVDGVRGLDLESDGLAREGLDEAARRER